ncbi:hypothetical protein FRB90_005213 [Tulasnella sp. 427]|nr:hypothetical protein FRB90_005213 [Tulasnella sp. 427]
MNRLLPGSTSQAHPGNKTSDRDQGTFFLQQAHQMYRESHVLRETLNAERLSRAREREQARERILELEEKLAVRSSENASLEEKLVAAVDTEVSLGKVIAAKDAEITAKDAEINDLREVVDVQTNELAKAMAAHTVQQQIASPTEAVSIGQRIEAQWTVRMAEKEQAWILEKTAMEMRLSSLEAELAKAEEIQQAYPEIFDAFIQMEEERGVADSCLFVVATAFVAVIAIRLLKSSYKPRSPPQSLSTLLSYLYLLLSLCSYSELDMGVQQSKQSNSQSSTPIQSVDEKVALREDQATLVGALQRFSVSDDTEPASADGTVNYQELKKWEEDAIKDPKTSVSRAVLDHVDMTTALLSRSARVADTHVFNLKLDYETSPITNQLSSGRCWLFASTNVIRYDAAQKLKIKDFQLSQSYLFFYDKLEKSNHFLELSIEHVDLPLDSRLITHLNSDPIGDGGQLDMAVNLIERYGVVPQSVYPEAYSSSYSSRMDRLITNRLREFSLALRVLVTELREQHSDLDEEHRTARIIAAARKQKEAYLAEIYRILCITLGVPPKPTDKFTFEYYDVDGKFNSYSGTPLEFYKKYRNDKYSLSDSFSLVNDPRNPYETLFTVDKLNNVWGGRPVLYVNTSSDELKQAVITSVKAGHPVFFGCDVGQFSNSSLGIMDTALYEYESAFNIKLKLTKAQRLQTGESSMTHAMVITAVHLDAEGKPVRYRVENSWGLVGDKGYFVMSDKWFDEFVYQVVIPRKLAKPDHVKILDAGNPRLYAPWDPMGTLA